MDLEALGDVLVEVSEKLILPRFQTLSEGEVVEKRPGDPVTIADREAEVELTRILRAEYPGVLVVGEEATFADPALEGSLGIERAFTVDPVDGTRNFAQGSPDFAVMVAELSWGRPVRAWIWQPIHRQLFTMERGAGVFCNGIQLPKFSPVSGRPQGAMFRWPGNSAAVAFRRTVGSCGIDYPKLLVEEQDFLVYRTLHPWDHLPGTAMVKELGGSALLRDGRPYSGITIGKDQLVASRDPRLDDLVRTELAQLGVS